MSYEERLRRTGLTTLEERRKRGDLIETFEMVQGGLHTHQLSLIVS